ncbi:Hypp3538 [Branchiostoma lanceolatum]|uniref:Hypp3538 protein n=1 Tax=Branchiostoma lanceolatum TaxID=7740 RepID=A0A8K0A189_BRALA|nr:Hypp3538 [Branchiostoma lanceolatum]
MTRFQTMRMNYFKLKRKVAGKSGQGQTKLTPLQDFNLRRYTFLDAHYRGKASSMELGSVPQPQSSSDEADDEAIPRTSAVTGSSDRSGHDGSGSPPKKKKKGMTEVLVDLLTDSQKELRQSQATLAEKWRAYQKDTFAVAMRYTTGEEKQPPQPPTPVFQPVQQHQVVQHQPAQYMVVPYGFGAPGQQHLRPPLVSATPPTTTVSPLRAEMVTLQNAGQEGSDKGASAED